MSQHERSISLIGEENIEKLKKSTVTVLGLGGVGSYAAEALARSGVGKLVLVDFSVIQSSNINRQIYALHSTVGKAKTILAAKRIADINPACEVVLFQEKITKETAGKFLIETDAVIDAIDDIAAKVAVAKYCYENKIPLISSMGTGNKIDAQKLRVADIYRTKICPLAKKMRHELKKECVPELKVVFSEEPPMNRNVPPSSMIFVPAAAGLLLAKEIIFSLLSEINQNS